MKAILPLTVAAVLAFPAFAHEGEDHSPAVAASLPSEATARSASATELFELVAVVSNGRLMLYLDRFETNEPVSGARIAVETGALKAVAAEVEPGMYEVVADAFGHPGPHPMTIDVQAGDDVDLLALTVDVASPSAAGVGVPAQSAWGWRHPVVWGASGAALLAGFGVVALRRRGGAANTASSS